MYVCMYTLCGKLELKVVGQFRHAATCLLTHNNSTLLKTING